MQISLKSQSCGSSKRVITASVTKTNSNSNSIPSINKPTDFRIWGVIGIKLEFHAWDREKIVSSNNGENSHNIFVEPFFDCASNFHLINSVHIVEIRQFWTFLNQICWNWINFNWNSNRSNFRANIIDKTKECI